MLRCKARARDEPKVCAIVLRGNDDLLVIRAATCAKRSNIMHASLFVMPGSSPGMTGFRING
jgi:hypothetical protein